MHVKYLKRGYPTELADSIQIHNKMVEIPNRNFSWKKYVWYFKCENELKIRIVATRGNLHDDPKSLKNYRNAKSINQNENFSKKSMFGTLKVERSQNFVSGLPDGICSGSPKSNSTQIKFKKL
jgi:hypothetical protein